MPYKSTNSKSFGEVTAHWGQLSSGLTANAAELPHLDAHRLQLEGVVTQARDVLSEQKTLAAMKQDVSRRADALIEQGTKLASFLRHGVKQHYGTRSEKLTEFDLLPFRGKATAPKPSASEPPPPSPAPNQETPQAPTEPADSTR